jgi:hypothetical protein
MSGYSISIFAELDMLPVGSVILDATGTAYQRGRDEALPWEEAGNAFPEPITFPVTVLHVPREA